MRPTEEQVKFLAETMDPYTLRAFLYNMEKKHHRSIRALSRFLGPDGSIVVNRITIEIVERELAFHQAKNARAKDQGECMQPFPMTVGTVARFTNGLLTEADLIW